MSYPRTNAPDAATRLEGRREPPRDPADCESWCQSACLAKTPRAGESPEEQEERQALRRRLYAIRLAVRKSVNFFSMGGGERMARESGVPFPGRIPIEPGLSRACDDGVPFVGRFPESETAMALDRAFRPVLHFADAAPSTRSR